VQFFEDVAFLVHHRRFAPADVVVALHLHPQRTIVKNRCTKNHETDKALNISGAILHFTGWLLHHECDATIRSLVNELNGDVMHWSFIGNASA
jgi:hypothetical protein